MNNRLLIGLLAGTVLLVGLAYAFQWQTILRFLPFALFLLCPLMHVFMTGHGETPDKDSERDTTEKRRPSCH